MMDHEHYRSAILANPRDPDPALREHREECAECRAFSESLLRFESRLERALKVKLPGADVLSFERATSTPHRAATAAQHPWRRFAIAASLALGLVAAGGLWLALPQRSLAAAVVAHMEEEPQAWRRTNIAVAGPALESVLRDSKLRLKSDAGVVSYANSCAFRGHIVPHLVMQTESGPVTVMVLVHESVNRPVQFDEQGYRGTIVPVPGHGALAVLMRDSGADGAVQRIAARIGAAIDWTD
ncbi:MAG TPA: DUF3379 family protein [Steroidobacteraceae bacterium]|jgi:hypothetical protein